MAALFIDRIWNAYPIPKIASIWGGDGNTRLPLEDIDLLIECCVDECATDLAILEYISATSMTTYMPEDTVTVSSAMLSSSMPFQGNRLTKATYDKAENKVYLKYFPANIAYYRKLRLEDLDPTFKVNPKTGEYLRDPRGRFIQDKPAQLQGDRLLYFMSYVMLKMVEKEISILKSVNLNVDNGNVDFTVLEDFKRDMKEKVETLKQDSILLYATQY